MNKKFEISVGKLVVLKPTYNSIYRYGRGPLEGIVSKIGRKYFFVECERLRNPARFRLTDFFHDDPSDSNFGFEIYESMPIYEDAMECSKKLDAIRTYFQNFAKKPSPETVRQIYDLLNIENNETNT